MFDLNDIDDILLFKKRLGATRKERGFTQQEFADALGDSNRSRVANWESQKSSTLVQLHDIPLICKLLETDPNYLLGFSDDISEDDTMIGEHIHMSPDNVRMLKQDPYIGRLIDFLLASDEFHDMVYSLQHLTMKEFHSTTVEKKFSPYALKKIRKAYQNYIKEILLFDIDSNALSYYAEKEFIDKKRIKNVFYLLSYFIGKELPWNPEKQSIEEYFHTIIIDEELYNECTEKISKDPNFMDKPDNEKFYRLMAVPERHLLSFLNDERIAKLSELEISNLITKLVSDFVQKEVNEFKQQKQ